MQRKIEEIAQIYIKIDDMVQKFNKDNVRESYAELKQGCMECIIGIKEICDDEHKDLLEPLCKIEKLLESSDGEEYNIIKRFFMQYREIVARWYEMTIHNEDTYNEELLENYFQTGYQKNALLIYIVHPFIFPNTVPGHTNQVEARIIAESLSNKKYNVDIINTNYKGKIEYKKYDVVIGYGNRFEEICYKKISNMQLICYLTEASPYFSNVAELKRLRSFQERNNYLPNFERLSMKCLNLSALIKADAAICLGNKWTASTYEGMFNKIYTQKVSGFSDCLLPDLKKEESVVRNFLWYGGAGPIHKGLDLCVEAFRSLPDLNLHIVGEVTTEFYRFYRSDIENAENILYYGFLNKDTEEFRKVCEKCGFCIVPSCSEGQSTAIITTMFSGIVPVCTVETGIDVEEAGGLIIQSVELNDLIKMIGELAEMKKEEFCDRQQRTYDYVMKNHTVENYRSNLDAILSDIIE